MCLYPKLIRNKRYQMYNTKTGDAKPIDDIRKQFVAVGCGNCIECRKQRARNWQIRLCEELKVHKYKYFVTLTFSAENLLKLCEEDTSLYQNVNKVAKKAVRRFLERWRKKYKKSARHWLITELGHEGTERIHLHGIIFTEAPLNNKTLQSIWQYGITDTGQYCNERTINYIVKYVTKIDIEHKGYVADIFCSAGIGANYINEITKHRHKFAGKDTVQYYTMPNGTRLALPIYYRNKLWTQKERDKLWTYTLDADRRYVRGIELRKTSTPDGYAKYLRLLHTQQQENLQMGYGSSTSEWNERTYKVTFDMVNTRTHVRNAHARG